MRTTVRLEPSLLVAAKRHAAESGRSLTRLIEDALWLELARKQKRDADAPVIELPSGGAGGLRPGVDLDDNAATRDLLDQE